MKPARLSGSSKTDRNKKNIVINKRITKLSDSSLEQTNHFHLSFRHSFSSRLTLVITDPRPSASQWRLFWERPSSLIRLTRSDGSTRSCPYLIMLLQYLMLCLRIPSQVVGTLIITCTASKGSGICNDSTTEYIWVTVKRPRLCVAFGGRIVVFPPGASDTTVVAKLGLA